ncbi:Uncharacterised protein [Mycobacteroides abscessus subsp. abscessus]|nr:Uncharacterised protein [Mycobacteroides abscessus subsp. abscessus]
MRTNARPAAARPRATSIRSAMRVRSRGGKYSKAWRTAGRAARKSRSVISSTMWSRAVITSNPEPS